MEGNLMKMREALEFSDRELRMATEDDRYGDDVVYLVGCMRTVAAICRAAIAAPPRNCDVGTAEEQEARFKVFCESHLDLNNPSSECAGCPLDERVGTDCEFAWAQMPYEADAKKEKRHDKVW